MTVSTQKIRCIKTLGFQSQHTHPLDAATSLYLLYRQLSSSVESSQFSHFITACPNKMLFGMFYEQALKGLSCVTYLKGPPVSLYFTPDQSLFVPLHNTHPCRWLTYQKAINISRCLTHHFK